MWAYRKKELIQDVLRLLYEHRLIRTCYRDKADGWVLISGLYSPVYIQLRPLLSYPAAFKRVCAAMAELIANEAPEINRIIGLAMAGVPLAAGIGLTGGLSAGFTRKIEGVKSLDQFRDVIGSYGEHSMVEGELKDGDRIALIDDLVTGFDSKLIAMEQVRHELLKRRISNVDCSTVAVILDREQGGAEAAQKAGVQLISLIPFKSVGMPLLKGVFEDEEWGVINDYLSEPAKFQDEVARQRLRSISKASDKK
jgi:orotate phosphoribosyltransferase